MPMNFTSSYSSKYIICIFMMEEVTLRIHLLILFRKKLLVLFILRFYWKNFIEFFSFFIAYLSLCGNAWLVFTQIAEILFISSIIVKLLMKIDFKNRHKRYRRYNVFLIMSILYWFTLFYWYHEIVFLEFRRK